MCRIQIILFLFISVNKLACAVSNSIKKNAHSVRFFLLNFIILSH